MKDINVSRVANANRAPTDDQLAYIDFLVAQLRDDGHSSPCIEKPTTHEDASRVIQSLVHICKKHNVNFSRREMDGK